MSSVHTPVFETFSSSGALGIHSNMVVSPSPTVDFGRDFDQILRKCLHERSLMQLDCNAVVSGPQIGITTGLTGSKAEVKQTDALYSHSRVQGEIGEFVAALANDTEENAAQIMEVGLEVSGDMHDGPRLQVKNSDLVLIEKDNSETQDEITIDITCNQPVMADNNGSNGSEGETQSSACDECAAVDTTNSKINDSACEYKLIGKLCRDSAGSNGLIAKYPENWTPAKKPKKRKMQGVHRKFKAIITTDIEVGFDLVKPCFRGCLSENTEDMDKELAKFEQDCKEEEPQPSTSAQADAADARREELAIAARKYEVKVFSEDEEEAYYYGQVKLFELEYRIIDTKKNVLSRKLLIIDDHIGFKHPRLRSKHKWAVAKAHIQVKSKHCTSVKNGAHGKKLYIKSRVVRLMNMLVEKRQWYNTNTLSINRIDKVRGFKPEVKLKTVMNKPGAAEVRQRSRGPDRGDKPPPAYALSAYNADFDLGADLVNILMAVQNRDLTPEDYDLLLRLDERVAPKTVDQNILERLPIAIATGSEGVCAVCLDDYTSGQKMKILPCAHAFHAGCIDNWLNNSSMNCPLDGLEVK